MAQDGRVVKHLTAWPLALGVCVLLLAWRSWFFLAWEESYFNSDQAILGLMAKHLAERRAWPLFVYGQEYMLAVEAWAAAPIVGMLGSSVATLRLALVVLNLATGLLLVHLLVRSAGLGLWSAVLASSPFWMAPLMTAANLVDAGGGNIEPFFWVLVVWWLRHQPLWLGIGLGVGFHNREFTIYAVPPLVAVQLIERRGIDRALLRSWLVAAIGFLLVAQTILLLKPHADLYGPHTAGWPMPVGGRTVAAMLIDRLAWQPERIGQQLSTIATDFLPALMGLTRLHPTTFGIDTAVVVGWPHLEWPVMMLGSAVVLWLLATMHRQAAHVDLFPAYLATIGVLAAVAYATAKPVRFDTIRYVLLVLYLPIGIAAMALHQRRARVLRGLGMAVLVALAVAAAIDHGRVLASARTSPPAGYMRAIADRLKAEQITVARSGYWRAYAVTYLTNETVKVASTDFERIAESRLLAEAAAASQGGVTVIQREPCAGAIQVPGSYICRKP